MAYAKTVFNKNFLEYASYVIKDRAIPDVVDGLKPVQRRILHSLFEMDDGKFHKVANVVGHAMRYHPHGDASIYSALVVVANKDVLIDKQGNFGNVLTGDEASAARYIECRINPLAKELLYDPQITEYEDSYDGRNKEPVLFPAKVPLVLVHGAEGIAVGMSTKILPHNFAEILEAMTAALRGEGIELYPDFQHGGLIDVKEYNDGRGKVLVRAKLDTKDPKRIIIRDVPFGSTTESLIASIEAAAKRGKLKIQSIYDYTSENVEIEIKLARGVHSREVVDALYAFTDCEASISVNPLVIKDNRPTIMSVTEIIQYHAGRLVEILKQELELERHNLQEKLQARTLERIFVEERIYKRIEEMETQEAVVQAVFHGFEPFKKELPRELTEDDVERLLKIPIRRISLYDINKAREEMRRIEERLTEIAEHLKNMTAYTIGYLEALAEKHGESYPRRTEITSFDRVDVREAADRNLPLRYDDKTGYLGYGMQSGRVIMHVSSYDRIVVVRKGGSYSAMDVPEKLFVDKGMRYCGFADKDEISKEVFSVLYKNSKGQTYLKRCRIEQFILGRAYDLVPEGGKLLDLTTDQKAAAVLDYDPNRRYRVLEEEFPVADYPVKGARSQGVKLTDRVLKKARLGRPRSRKRSGA